MKNTKGQSTIEFTLTLLLLLGFVLFFAQLSFVFAWGSYVQYATFMSARAYMAGGTTKDDQKDRASLVLRRMVKKGMSNNTDRIPFLAKGDGGDDVVGASFDSPEGESSDRHLSWQEGVRYRFKSRIFILPIGQSREASESANVLTLQSESWLGREPTYDECTKQMESKGIFDNGC